MKKILILMGRYLPGHKDGGPLRTIANVVEALGDEYDLYVACLDRDHGDTAAYRGIAPGEWNRVGKAKVWYVAPGGFSNALILKLAEGKDSIYLTSFYDDYGYKTLWLKRTGKLKAPVALASMGVFSKGALAQKALKKKVFIAGCKLLGLFRDVIWSVTSELEAEDLKRVVGRNARYIVAEDLPRSEVPGRNADGYNGPLRIAFLSRICEHKGLDIAIDAIKRMKSEYVFTIFGPVQEQDYWRKCQEKLKEVKNWSYQGDVPSDQVQTVLSSQDVLVLPTKSENYGHVIFEALSVGCIPIISPHTPWGMVEERGAGRVVAREADAITDALQRMAQAKAEEREAMAANAVRLAQEKLAETVAHTGYRTFFSR